MRLLTRSTRPDPERWEDSTASFTPRLAAIRLLREKIDAGLAGLDPYMPSDFIVVAHENETVWVNRCCDLTGAILYRMPHHPGGERFRVVLEADVRSELGLDGESAPLMADEPLASRGVAAAAALLMDATVEAIERRGAAKVVSEPVSIAARREAKAAYDQRYPHGVEPQLVIRTDPEAS